MIPIRNATQGWKFERFNPAGVPCSRSDGQTCKWRQNEWKNKINPEPLLKVETEEGEKIHYHQVYKPSLTNRETVTLSTTRSHDLLYVRSYHPITLGEPSN